MNIATNLKRNVYNSEVHENVIKYKNAYISSNIKSKEIDMSTEMIENDDNMKLANMHTLFLYVIWKKNYRCWYLPIRNRVVK